MSDLLHTPLTKLHESLGAKMVGFAGYSMPIQYEKGIIHEHLHTRSQCAIFDVSHMGQLYLRGENVAEKLEKILPVNVIGLAPGRQRYAFFTLENGGLLDDLMLATVDEKTMYMVVNASRKDVDLPHMQKHLDGVEIEEVDDALIALQGPKAVDVLNAIIPGVADMKFMDNRVFDYNGASLRISRSGYTGEDGYEIGIPKSEAETFVKRLLENEAVEMAGLGARDSLRTESGLCLYGNDITEGITPIEADLAWAIQKIRKSGGEREGGFIGADVILKQIADKPARKRVGIAVEGKVPVRHGVEILDENGNVVGEVTSGCFGASADAPVGMGYVNLDLAETGTKLKAQVRKKLIDITVADLPFVPHNFYRG